MADSDSEDEQVAAMARDDSKPDIPFDSKTTVCVLDMRSMCELPVDLETNGVSALRALLLPLGKTLHVPGEPGCYVTDGDFRQQMALCKVYFVEATKREPELLLCFSDYGVLNPKAKGTFVISLALPLQKRRNVYEETPRHTKISDVAGFSPINDKEMPWSAHLKPALLRQPMFSEINAFSQLNLIGWMKNKLEDRIEILAKRANTAIVAVVSDIARQGAREAEQRKATLVAGLDMTLTLLAALPPSKYDGPLTKRVIKLADLTADTQPAWLKTPERQQLAQGEAVCRPTTLAQRRLAPSPAAAAAPAGPTVATDVPAAAVPSPPPAAAADPAATAAAAAAFLGRDDDLNGDNGVGATEPPKGSKRARNAPERHTPDEPTKPKPARESAAAKVQANP